jgi:iron(III) transport system ATP-binding protein
MSKVLTLEDVWLERRGVTVLHGISLSVAAGETLLLVGPSGCGKSTLLRVVLGLLPADRGRVVLREKIATDGHRMPIPIEDRNIGMVFQDLALWPHFTVERHLGFVLASRGVSGSERDGRIAAILERFGLSGKERKRPGELSGGEQQRVALARAVVTEPDLILLDEPLSQLDAFLRDDLTSFLRELFAERRAAVVYVAHDPVEMRLLADRIAVMEDGRIIQTGTWRELRATPAAPIVRRLLALVGSDER